MCVQNNCSERAHTRNTWDFTLVFVRQARQKKPHTHTHTSLTFSTNLVHGAFQPGVHSHAHLSEEVQTSLGFQFYCLQRENRWKILQHWPENLFVTVFSVCLCLLQNGCGKTFVSGIWDKYTKKHFSETRKLDLNLENTIIPVKTIKGLATCLPI